MAEPVASPCRRECTLDERDVCMGCGRTLVEITGWSRMDDDARRRVVAAAAERREEYRRRFPWAMR
jgi:hypothetical protein